jgi:DNA polymerase III epsilon subunit-like protein
MHWPKTGKSSPEKKAGRDADEGREAHAPHFTTMHFIATDTETGGVYPAIHALLSIGACCSWSPDTFLAYITPESQPEKSVCAEAAAKNGYTPEKWAALGARPLAEVLGEFVVWIGDRKAERRQAKIVCHHLAFDRSFFSEAERVTGYQIPHRSDWRCSQVKFGELMDAGLIELGSSSLNRLIELSGWTGLRLDEHDALQDAEATLHGYAWLLDKAKTPEATLRHLYNRCLMDRKNLEAFIVSVQEAVHELLSERDQQRPITKATIQAELDALVANLSEKKEGRVDA